MQWTKVSVKHAELIFSDAPDSVFRTYVRLMLLTSSMEVAPTSAQLSLKLGKRKMESLLAYLETKEISVRHIIDKVMEDVDSVLKQREGGKNRQRKHRVTRDVTEQDKIREDKIRYIGNSKFVKPSLVALNKYCLETDLRIDTTGFIDYYESNGWKVGRNPMKDWKATARNWGRKEPKKPKGQVRVT